MPDYVPNFEPGARTTWTVGASAVIGGRLAAISATGRTVIQAPADSPSVIGVFAHDAAVGEKVTVLRGGEQTLLASGAITAGAKVKAAAAGQVAAGVIGTDGAHLFLGTAVNTVVNGATVDVVWGV